MKTLKDCDVEPGDMIELESGFIYECLPIITPNLVGSKEYKYKYPFRSIQNGELYEILSGILVKQIIKKDPKKEILQKIEEHKSEIQILENQLKEMNSLKVGEVYRVKINFTHNGAFGIYSLKKDEMLYLVSKTNNESFFSNIANLRIIVELNSITDYLELVNDPEMTNGVQKFFKGNS